MVRSKQWWREFSRRRTVGFAVDGALVEDHDVLGQCSCFVAEDVLDLTELLVQGGGAGLGGGVAVGVVHLPVPVDVEAVPQTDDLHAEEGSAPFRELIFA